MATVEASTGRTLSGSALVQSDWIVATLWKLSNLIDLRFGTHRMASWFKKTGRRKRQRPDARRTMFQAGCVPAFRQDLGSVGNALSRHIMQQNHRPASLKSSNFQNGRISPKPLTVLKQSIRLAEFSLDFSGTWGISFCPLSKGPLRVQE